MCYNQSDSSRVGEEFRPPLHQEVTRSSYLIRPSLCIVINISQFFMQVNTLRECESSDETKMLLGIASVDQVRIPTKFHNLLQKCFAVLMYVEISLIKFFGGATSTYIYNSVVRNLVWLGKNSSAKCGIYQTIVECEIFYGKAMGGSISNREVRKIILCWKCQKMTVVFEYANPMMTNHID